MDTTTTLGRLYSNANTEAGHASDCAWGAGSDCSCARRLPGLRAEYRAAQVRSGLDCSRFAAAVAAEVSWLDAPTADDYADAARDTADKCEADGNHGYPLSLADVALRGLTLGRAPAIA